MSTWTTFDKKLMEEKPSSSSAASAPGANLNFQNPIMSSFTKSYMSSVRMDPTGRIPRSKLTLPHSLSPSSAGSTSGSESSEIIKPASSSMISEIEMSKFYQQPQTSGEECQGQDGCPKPYFTKPSVSFQEDQNNFYQSTSDKEKDRNHSQRKVPRRTTSRTSTSRPRSRHHSAINGPGTSGSPFMMVSGSCSPSYDTMYRTSRPKIEKNSSRVRSRSGGKNAKIDQMEIEALQNAKELEKRRIQCLKLRTICAFQSSAIEKTKREFCELSERFQVKKLEGAARSIRHTLLLNAYRKCEKKNTSLVEEKFQLQNTVENSTIQLRVTRHLHLTEKANAISYGQEAKMLSNELCLLRSNFEKNKTELEKVEDELNSMHGKLSELYEENQFLKNEVKLMKDNRKALLESVKKEQRHVEELEILNARFQKNISEIEIQLSTTTEERSHWQEKAMNMDSEIYQARNEVQTLEKYLNNHKAQNQVLEKENEDLKSSKLILEQNLKLGTEEIRATGSELKELRMKFNEMKAYSENHERRKREIERELTNLKIEAKDVRMSMASYAKKNAARRRFWGNTFYFLVSPFGWVRYILLGKEMKRTWAISPNDLISAKAKQVKIF